MMSDIRMEKVLEAIYEHILEHMPEEACDNCGVLRILGDLMVVMKKENNREIALEMGFDCMDVKCPFIPSTKLHEVNTSKLHD